MKLYLGLVVIPMAVAYGLLRSSGTRRRSLFIVCGASAFAADVLLIFHEQHVVPVDSWIDLGLLVVTILLMVTFVAASILFLTWKKRPSGS